MVKSVKPIAIIVWTRIGKGSVARRPVIIQQLLVARSSLPCTNDLLQWKETRCLAVGKRSWTSSGKGSLCGCQVMAHGRSGKQSVAEVLLPHAVFPEWPSLEGGGETVVLCFTPCEPGHGRPGTQNVSRHTKRGYSKNRGTKLGLTCLQSARIGTSKFRPCLLTKLCMESAGVFSITALNSVCSQFLARPVAGSHLVLRNLFQQGRVKAHAFPEYKNSGTIHAYHILNKCQYVVCIVVCTVWVRVATPGVVKMSGTRPQCVQGRMTPE
mmetsp:Transcript_104604/g.176780  ORF Transcript_104604/g.176780 Transcript_104604/m.176780 type:complete len:268 (-) Transcript_104604:4-807(-)